MNATLRNIKVILAEAVKAAGFEVEDLLVELSPTKVLAHGHMATNVALILAKKLGKNPREVAQNIADQLKNHEWVDKVEVAGPGFVNLFIVQKFYSEFCQSISQNIDLYLKNELEFESGRTMAIDYSHPNIAKPMGVHHLLTTIIGDSIKKIYRKVGYKVIADNFIGDLGTQFGKLIYAIKTWGDFSAIEKDPINELLKLYVKFHNEAENDSKLEDYGRAEYRKFEEGDADSRELWKKIVEWSFLEIQPIYDRLDIQFDYMNGESFYEDKMPAILKEGRDKGVFVDGEKGAWIVPSDNPDEPPAVIKKSDGATLYITRDLARIKYWEEAWHPDLMINVVDSAQELYFRQLFFVAEKLKLTSAQNIHVSFGRMQFKDAGMSTRKGKVLHLVKVLDEAEKRSLSLVQQKGADLSEDEKVELARIIGIGSIKYNVLHQNRIQNMTFEWDKMLSFEGNSAPYLMYTVARAKSLIRKSGLSGEKLQKAILSLSDECETSLVLNLAKYADALSRAKEEFKPNHIANYLYHLAQDFNTFYNAMPILQAEDQLKKSRLLLVLATIKVMEDGLSLLGVESPDKM